MPVTITKGKTAKPVSKAKSTEKTLIQVVVERLAETKKILDAAKKAKVKFDLDKKILEDLLPGKLAPEDGHSFLGEKFVASFGPQSEIREITDIHKIRALLGDEVFFAICKVNLGDLDKYLTEPEQKDVVKKSRTGSRSFTITEV